MKRSRLGDVVLTVVEDEKPSDSIDVTENAVESGQDVADHIKQKSTEISISGVLVGDDASSNMQKLRDYQRKGELLTYTGRNVYNNLVIQSFGRGHGKKIANGFSFNIKLKRIRIATAQKVNISINDPNTNTSSDKNDTRVKDGTNKGKQQAQTKAISTKQYDKQTTSVAKYKGD